MGVTGIGGFFFRAQNPETLAAWYSEHLGVGGGEMGSWEQQAGQTIFSPFEAGTDYFPADKQWMLNFRVEGLDELKVALAAKGIEVITNPRLGCAGRGPVRARVRPRGQSDRALGARLTSDRRS